MADVYDDAVLAGQAVYSKRTLAAYDFFVLGFSNRFVWRCPTPRILRFYDEHISANHMDVGVGTGYFLDRCTFPQEPRIALVDLNSNSLEATARRIARYHPETYRANVLEPLAFECPPFATIGMNYLFHCLPGDIHTKAAAFDHVMAKLEPGGTVFGSTLLQGGVQRSRGAVRLMDVYNRKGIFSNDRDDRDGLREELARRFADYGVDVVGSAALFWGRTAS